MASHHEQLQTVCGKPLKSIFLSKNMLTNKKILVGITGSIAAYKTITLVRLLVKAGAE
ncbi:MAG: hypothetical protein RLZZ420_221, partial [Bacteroidota bacterium]